MSRNYTISFVAMLFERIFLLKSPFGNFLLFSFFSCIQCMHVYVQSFQNIFTYLAIESTFYLLKTSVSFGTPCMYIYIVLRAGLLLPRTKVGTAHASNSTFELILWNRKLVSFNLTWLNKLKVLSLVNSSRNGAFQPGWRSNMTCKIWWKTWVELRRTKPVNSSKI